MQKRFNQVKPDRDRHEEEMSLFLLNIAKTGLCISVKLWLYKTK